MPLDMPFTLGPFRVNQEGRLALAHPDSVPRLHFAWRGCRVSAVVGARSGGDGSLAIVAELGRVPSTATVPSDAAATRDTVFEALRDLRRLLPSDWTLALLADHRVTLRASRALSLPTTACSLVSELTMFLLALGPYLDLLAVVGVEEACGAAAPGTENTWPG
jgi:hypothetical protein